MDTSLVTRLKAQLAEVPTPRLRSDFEGRDFSRWSPEALEAMRQLLRERGEAGIDDAPLPGPAPAPEPPGLPSGRACPACGGTAYKTARPAAWVAYRPDRICAACGTRYQVPAPAWAGAVFLLVGLLLAGVAAFEILLRLAAIVAGGERAAVVAVGAVIDVFIGALGVAAIRLGVRSLGRR